MTVTIAESLKNAITASNGDRAARQALAAQLRSALNEVETPQENFWRLTMAPHQFAVVRSAIELKWFVHLLDGPKTAHQLAELSGADYLLIVRFMRVLSATGMVKEVGVQQYENSPAGKVLAVNAGPRGALSFMQEPFSEMSCRCIDMIRFDVAAQAAVKIPQTLKENNWQSPSMNPIVFKKAFGEEYNAFTWMGAHPQDLEHFNGMMTAQRHQRRNWYDLYPVQDQLINGADPSAPLLVDIGGASGYELATFKERFPDNQGELVLEDLPHTIESITSLDTSIRRVKHDFFTEQPVQGARAYYFRSIFHDWPDHKCREILRNLKPAMKVGYSKLLLNDWVLPEQGAPLFSSLLDINMLALFGSMERTTTQFKQILESEGFEFVQLHGLAGAEAVIEAIPKADPVEVTPAPRLEEDVVQPIAPLIPVESLASKNNIMAEETPVAETAIEAVPKADPIEVAPAPKLEEAVTQPITPVIAVRDLARNKNVGEETPVAEAVTQPLPEVDPVEVAQVPTVKEEVVRPIVSVAEVQCFASKNNIVVQAIPVDEETTA